MKRKAHLERRLPPSLCRCGCTSAAGSVLLSLSVPTCLAYVYGYFLSGLQTQGCVCYSSFFVYADICTSPLLFACPYRSFLSAWLARIERMHSVVRRVLRPWRFNCFSSSWISLVSRRFSGEKTKGRRKKRSTRGGRTTKTLRPVPKLFLFLSTETETGKDDPKGFSRRSRLGVFLSLYWDTRRQEKKSQAGRGRR